MRFVGGDPHHVLYMFHYIANRGLTVFSNMLTGLNLSDMEAGYKKVFTREALARISGALRRGQENKLERRGERAVVDYSVQSLLLI
ncbi:MAG: hypothetical protein AAB767_01340 [Patescibacteria group bacterium]